MLVAPLCDVVRGLDRLNMPIGNVRTMEKQFRMRSTAILDVVTDMIAAMGVVGLALAVVGLYGLVAYGVSRRTREIGIRIAIGAWTWDVLRMVWQQGALLALAGLTTGLVVSVGVARALGTVFPGGAEWRRPDRCRGLCPRRGRRPVRPRCWRPSCPRAVPCASIWMIALRQD